MFNYIYQVMKYLHKKKGGTDCSNVRPQITIAKLVNRRVNSRTDGKLYLVLEVYIGLGEEEGGGGH